jgi:hypothetical protein
MLPPLFRDSRSLEKPLHLCCNFRFYGLYILSHTLYELP